MKINRGKGVYSYRYYMIIGLILILMGILVARIFVLTILEHESWLAQAKEQSVKTIYTSAPRGNIYDCNGKIIATNKQIFTVTFNSSGLTTEQINDSCLRLMELLIRNGDSYTDNFPIRIKKGKFYYTYDKSIQKWLTKMKLPEDLSAGNALSVLRKRYKISESKSRYEAMEELEDKYHLDIPINVREMRYTYDIEKEQFIAKWGFYDLDTENGFTAEKCFNALREQYSISPDLSDRKVRRIFVIRNEIATNGYTRYQPITIAKNVSNETIAKVEEMEIPGASIASQYKRYYPNKNAACHIIGYMGSISEDSAPYYVDELGYNSTDLIGIDGIEYSFEKQLHGRDGVRKIQVNSSGEYVDTIEETDPKKGKDVFLSLDLSLQETAEKALRDQIAKVGGKCQSGATVAIDVKTGNVLAMASYPTYDPNIFSGGITEKAWQSVQAKNPRDPLSPTPLYNNATKTAVAPGSTFKPCSAMTALECGLDPEQFIYDKGYITMGGHTWACSNWNDGYGTHGSENLEAGIGNSCNFYFYCIATGKDWNTGASLGYDKKITVDSMLKMAKKFGLGQETGIELDESIVPLASAERKRAGYKLSAWNYMYDNAHAYFPAKIADDYSKLSEQLSLIAGWIDENPSYDEILDRLLKQTDVKEDYAAELANMLKYSYFNQAKWNIADQFNICIGQGDNAYTPLQMANYIATIGNGGVWNRVSIVSGVEGEGLIDKSGDRRKIKLKSSTIPNVIKGMKRVTTAGTLAGVFNDLGVEVAGKTGTAENQGIPQPASEVNYIKEHLASLNASAGTQVTWEQVEKTMKKLMKESNDRYPTKDDTVDEALKKASNYKVTQGMIDADKGEYDYYSWTVTMAPADEPRIAVATLLIQGGYSSNAAPVNKTIMGKYLKLYSQSAGETADTDQNGENQLN
ncbi:MAG: hypothetical protein IIZ43_04505 [Eubacterium sp.]|nr:hypothetical protein [Eubacterium sp.]